MKKSDSMVQESLIAELKESERVDITWGGLRVNANLKLIPVGSWVLSEYSMIDDFVKWRHEHRRNFFAQVPATRSSMSGYLSKHALAEKNRILFVISWRGVHVGHVGLANITRSTAELDNVMRGVKTYPGMMVETLEFLRAWSHRILGIERLYLRVKKTNRTAFQLYLRSGFRPNNEEAKTYLNDEDALTLERDGGILMVYDFTQFGAYTETHS